MSTLIDSVKSISDLVHYSRRPLPASPDGLTASEAAPAAVGKPADHGKLYDIIDDIQAAIKRGPPINLDDGTVAAIVDAILHAKTTGIDDRYLLLEKVFTLTSRLPPGSIIQQKITDAIISLLYRDLPHPPGTYLGKKYAFRTADGSYNNITIPDLGKAKSPYTRTVQSRYPIPYSSLPDPGLLFDTLLKRDGLKPQPAGISSLLFAFANLIIHSIFKTDEKNKHINNTSSYLDLAPLYGDSEAVQKTVRQCDGRGLLWEDCFADQRMLMMPPNTPALLIMFCRNHNFIARRILQLNERRTYTDPPPQNDPAALMTQDDDIFNRARLVNCAHFTNIILSDYIGAILNLTKEGNTWSLNPLEAVRELDSELLPRGQGNVVSVEFNLLYRWHATISEPDEKWTEDLFRKMFPDKPFHSLTVADFRQRVAELRLGPSAAATTANPTPAAQEISNSAHGTTGGDQSGVAVPCAPCTTTNGAPKPSSNGASKPSSNGRTNGNTHSKERSASSTSTAVVEFDDGIHVLSLDPRQLERSKTSASSSSSGAASGPRTWTFGGLERGPTGKFDDDKLADILQNATETPAQAFRARGTPEVLKVVEMMAIEEARQWGVCTMNEFRQFIGLKAYSSFEEWNPDPEIANAARALYGHIDNLELYVGMQAEQTKVPGPGAGLCPGYTISRAILGDAVALTRGDRFLTVDMTPYNLTAWGFQDCARDPNNGAFGSGLAKILLRGLPCNYTYNSVYALFAFYTPKTMVSVLSNLHIKDLYDFKRPCSEEEIGTVNSYVGANQVLLDYQSFKVTYERAMKRLTNGYGFFLAFDEPAKHLRDLKLMREALFPTDGTMAEYAAFYRETTSRLIENNSFSIVGKGTRCVDIVRDVFNLVPVHWISKQVAGIPLKTKETPNGIHTPQEVYQFMAVCFTYIFLNVQPETGWILEESSEKVAKLIQGYVKGHIEAIRSRKISFSKLKDSFLHWFTGEKDKSHEFLKRLAATNRSSDELSYNVFGIIVASCANFSMAASLILNFYLDDARKAEREEIIKLVKSDKPESNSLLLGYILEALRLDPQAPGVCRQAAVDAEVKEGNGIAPVRVNKGEIIFVSLENANNDPTTFPDPQKIDPTRPLDRYRLFGAGMHSCLGQWFTQAMMPEVMRCVFSLKNIRRAPGETGKLNRFRCDIFGTTKNYLYVDMKGNPSPFPASMVFQYDI